MNSKKLVLALMGIAVLISMFTENAQADVAFAIAESPDNRKWIAHYSWSTGGNEKPFYQRDRECINNLKKKGFSTVRRLVVPNYELDYGYFVIVSSTYQYGNDRHSTMGAGAGSSQQEALNNALKCLSTYDWTWVKSKHGYKLEHSDRF
ncbi:MAG: hypothetical protein P1V20_11295 [Verrucomicrobiales bacterium]|nr:hypothetical protein [Verrucomicrobiales bacterium]